MISACLSRACLDRLPAGVGAPRYPLGARRPAIVHLGLSGFARAHLCRYAHDLMQENASGLAFGVVGAGLTPADQPLAAALTAQDGLYTLVERSSETDTATVVGSVLRMIEASASSSALLEAIDVARIVSLTVTEAGYGLDRATRRLDPTLPPIARDLQAPERPATPVGVLVQAYRRRRAAGRPAFTALSCDNIQDNGAVLRGAVLDFADRVDPSLAAWIAREGRFPSTMVDRITPVFSPDARTFVAERFGVEDRRPVVSEAFRQWVVEDDFADGRPDWDRVGAQFVKDVAPYERMKLRLLNASHLAVAGLAALMGDTYVHEAMERPKLRRYMAELMDRETGATLLPVPGVDLPSYKAELVRRFGNPKIRDTVQRVNTDAPVNYLLDPVRECLDAGGGIDLLALALAAWLRRVRGEDEAGAPLPVVHPQADKLAALAREGGPDPRPLLGLRTLFGDLGERPRLVEATRRHLRSLYEVGAAQTLALAVGDAP